MSVRATNLVILVLLLLVVAACGDGGEQRAREDDGGSEPSSTELQQIELALEQLDARITRLEAATDELLQQLGGDAALLQDLPALIEELRSRRAALSAAAGLGEAPTGDDEPCRAAILEDCVSQEALRPAAP